ncbi:hypothetical protein ACLKA7_005692 [Drosophila subpalustris]
MDGASAVTKRNSHDTPEGVQGEDPGKIRRPKVTRIEATVIVVTRTLSSNPCGNKDYPSNPCGNKDPVNGLCGNKDYIPAILVATRVLPTVFAVARIKPAIPEVTRIFRFKQFCEYAWFRVSVRVSLGGARAGNKLLRTQDLSIFLAVARISFSGLCDSESRGNTSVRSQNASRHSLRAQDRFQVSG